MPRSLLPRIEANHVGRNLTLVIVAAVLAALAIGSSTAEKPADHSTAMLIGPPRSAGELAGPASAIVIARVMNVHATGRIGSYDATDDARNEKAGDPVTSRLPATDYELRVEVSLPGRTPVHAGDTILLRMLGIPENDAGIFPVPQVGERKLYVLSLNPDKSTYGPYHGPWSIFDIEGEVVTFGDGARSRVPFAPNANTKEFLDLLRAAFERVLHDSPYAPVIPPHNFRVDGVE